MGDDVVELLDVAVGSIDGVGGMGKAVLIDETGSVVEVD